MAVSIIAGVCRVSLPSMLDLSFCSTSDDVQHITFVAIVGELGCASAYHNLDIVYDLEHGILTLFAHPWVLYEMLEEQPPCLGWL